MLSALLLLLLLILLLAPLSSCASPSPARPVALPCRRRCAFRSSSSSAGPRGESARCRRRGELMPASPSPSPSSGGGHRIGFDVVAARPSSAPEVVVRPRGRLENSRDDGDGDDTKDDIDDGEEYEDEDDVENERTRRRLIVCEADIVLPFSEDLAFEYFSDLTRQP
jgi:hypothetical protein